MVEPDPKANNLFERYIPDAPAKQTKGIRSRLCRHCDVRIMDRYWDQHLASMKHRKKARE